MAKINILPSKVYNRIAAGEVVDRPCSVVKELVENAIDAGASEISIYIEQGGKQLVRVVDNGSGIEREDLPSAFLPHATSKIAKAEDLENILTLGFRGEAIASISAVSKMTITSKTQTGECYRLTCNGGELGQITQVAGEKGTDVEVETLFYHTPVRLAFLKSDKGEETEITNFVTRFILCRSDIAFTYYANGKKILQSFGDGDESAMLAVYGAATLSECFCIDAEKHGIRVRGYIGNQNYSKANKSYQSVFLNGRYILNSTLSASIANAYASYLMKRQYPFYVLHIDVPTEIVDVNVHPNKADVRFADNQIVYGCVYTVISAILDGQTKALSYIVKTPQTAYAEPPKPKAETSTPVESAPPKTAGFVSLSYEQAKREIEESAPAFVAKKQGMELPFEEVAKSAAPKAEQTPPEEKKAAPHPKGFIPMEQIGPYIPKPVDPNAPKKRVYKKNGAEILHKKFPDLYFDRPMIVMKDPASEQGAEQSTVDPFLANKQYLEELEKQSKQNRIEVAAFNYAGKLFNTYLLYELLNDVYIIDQHAAHERLIFNRLKAQMETRAVVRQPMLLPYELKLNAFEGEFLREHLSAITEMGFTLTETTANVFSVEEIPLDLQAIDLGAFFHEILGDISGYRAIKLQDLLKDKLASAACKAAVKGGMDLTQEEIDALFALMDGDMGLKCPHGRPVVVKLTKTELEKMFKRIV